MAKKKQSESQAPTELAAVTAENKPAETKEVTLSERDSIYERYDEATGLADKQPEKPAEEQVTEPSTEEKEESPELGTDKTEYTESPTLEEEKQSEHEQKTVPLQALHEEREKRKSLSALVKDLQDREKLLLEDLKGFVQKPQEEQISDYETEIKSLKAQVQELKSGYQKQQTSEKEREEKRYIDEQSTKINKAMKELEEEKIPVLPWFSQIIAVELNRIAMEDPNDSAHQAMVQKMWNDPTAWKKLYQEKVVPELKKHTEFLAKKEKDVEKEKAKAEAKLAGSPGRALVTEKPKEDDYTYESYMEDRRKLRVT